MANPVFYHVPCSHGGFWVVIVVLALWTSWLAVQSAAMSSVIHKVQCGKYRIVYADDVPGARENSVFW